MARGHWHLQRSANGLTLARHWPPRFDVRGVATLAVPSDAADGLCLLRLAHQIRQDLWRGLQSLRGFSPVVSLTRQGNVLEVAAGGRAAPPVPPQTSDTIAALLTDPRHARRWLRWAGQGRCP